jgi:hypothetical protein
MILYNTYQNNIKDIGVSNNSTKVTSVCPLSREVELESLNSRHEINLVNFTSLHSFTQIFFALFTSIQLASFKIIRFISILIILLSASFSLFSNIIEVGGVLTESTLWTSQDTVIVYQNLTIPSGVMVVVEAGALIKVAINRGIIVDKGSFLVSGTPNDSVRFIANHSAPGLNWKWKGIVIKNANIEEPSRISYAHIEDAETGIKLEDCLNVSIENTSILNCQNIGFQLVNSASCLMLNCDIENNYDGIEILVSYLGNSSNNVINSCVIRNQNNNIYVHREWGSIYKNNLVSGNLIDSGNNGFWIDNNGESVNFQNIVEENIFINNGSDVGYGLFLAYDSTIVQNNIFWNNNIAIFSGANGNNCQILNNSFYQNKRAIAVGPGSYSNNYNNNTFLQNEIELLGIKESRDVAFSRNNLLHNIGMQDIVINNTIIDMPITENYWGSTDTSFISTLIFDNEDNPNIGKLFYKPFLLSLDTSNPISPPFNVIKQIVNNKVKITWISNAEYDLAGYNVYYDDFVNYSFSEKYVVGTDTSFTFPNYLSINNIIGVTAFDSLLSPSNGQNLGHESPFSFAVLYPYAGADSIICKHLDALEIVSATIPMAYTNIYWQTSGDGFFTDSTIQFPSYFPGVEDVHSGSVLLTLVVIAYGDTLIDSFSLSIMDNPIAYAGNDTVIIVVADILLADAIADNYDNILWLTDGDGVFNYDTIMNPIYYPGSSDIELGIVYLEMIAYSQCGFSSDTIIINIEPYYSVEGRIWTDKKSLNNGIVIAFKNEVDGARAIKSESVISDGLFKFEKLMEGNYFLYALPDTNNADNFVPGYYANKLRWQNAYLLPVDANVYDVDIYLPRLDNNLPMGEGSISGHMVLPISSKFNSNVYCAPWFGNTANSYCNGGLSNLTVFLFNESKSNLLDYTLTDELGNFYFSSLPYGSYVVDAEKAGFKSEESSLIKLSPEHKSETDIVLEFNNQKLAFHLTNNVVVDNVLVYPNPASTMLNVPLTGLDSSPSHIEIFNIFGTRVFQVDIPNKGSSYDVKLNISKLFTGLYFGRIIYSSGSANFHFVKM